ncbi:MAG: beta-ketoacyl synthase N-terminal-like domain-containing protein, partial [Bauldia litoralis]
MRRVVVTGLGLVTPLGTGVDESWNNLINGRSGIRRLQRMDLSDLASQIGGQILRPEDPPVDGIAPFDAEDWMPKKDLKKVDDFITFAMAAATQAVDDAGWAPEDEESLERTGVLIGSGIGGLQEIYNGSIVLHERGPRRLSPFFIPAALINLASGHVSIKYGFKGPNHAVVTACSTGAHAIGDATRLIMLGDADV